MFPHGASMATARPRIARCSASRTIGQKAIDKLQASHCGNYILDKTGATLPDFSGQAGDETTGVRALSPPSIEQLANSESVRDLEYRPEILALAEDLVADCDSVGIETTQLEYLLRAVLFLDRSWRS